MTPTARERAADIAWIALWVAVSGAWCLSAASRLSATFDEPTYIAAGLERWRSGSTDTLMRLGTMPLPVDVATLPLFIAEKMRGAPLGIAADARGLVVNLTDLPAVLPLARAAMLPLWALLVAAVFQSTRRAGGRAAGYFAVVLVAVEPTLLAHAGLATTDLALTAFVVAFGAAFAGGRDAAWTRRIALPGVLFGLALLSKVSALVFCAAVLAAVELSRPPAPGRWQTLHRDGNQIAVIGLALTFIYCGSGWHRQESFVEWAGQRPDGVLSDALRFVAAHLKIFSNAGEAIVRQLAHNVRGHGVFILGRSDPRALWYYFPIALTMKISAAMLMALVWIAIRRLPVWRSWPLVAAVIILVLSPAFRVQTGVRLILPIFPLIIIGVSLALADTLKSENRTAGRRAAVVAMIFVAWTAVHSARLWPDTLRFTNELWGGTSRGYLRLSDSNYDWGQGLIDLEAWQQRTRTTPLDLWYWGTDPRASSGPWRMRRLQDLPLTSAADVQRELAGRYLAASTTLVYGSVSLTGARLTAIESIRAALRAQQPVGRTTTFLIYDFTKVGELASW